ncbi:hypothetical protein Tco_1474297 [Tanacetum coccineum]
MAQHVIPTAQLVPQYKLIGRCNNYAVLQSIPCSPECKIVGLILLDHCLSHALTATADVPAVYLQQFWRMVSKNLFVAPINIHTIEAFMNRGGYQGVVDKLIVADLTKKFPNIPKRIDEDFHSIKDDVSLVSVYTTGNVLVQGMLILDAFLTTEIRETDDFKEYETVFMKVDVLMNQPRPVVSTQGTHMITPTVSASPLESKKRKQTAGESSSPTKSLKITIKQKQIVKKDDDDSEDAIEPGSHKDNPEVVDDDDDKEGEKKDDEMGSLETRNEEMQITIFIPLSSLRKILSSDKKTFQELTDIVSNPTTSTSKHSKVKKRISSKYSHIPGALRRMCRGKMTFTLIMMNIKTMMLLLRGEKSEKEQNVKKIKEEENVIDEDEVIPEDVTPELIAESQNVHKRVPTIFDHARMEATLRDSLSNMSRNAEEYAYHLEQSTSFMENKIVWERRQQDIPCTIPKTLIFYGPQRNPNEPPRPLYNKDLFFLKYGNTEEKKYILSLHKIHAEEFLEPDLEEKLNRWVWKEFNTFNEDAQLSIQHWKDSWHKRAYKQNQKKVKKNPEDYYSNQMITEVVRIVTDQPHGLDFMKQILVMRANDKPDSFSKADFKYLNKNDIEDLYYLYKKRVMYLEDIVKFCDATLEKVLDEVKLRMFESKYLKKSPLIGELDQDVMKAYERETSMRLSH